MASDSNRSPTDQFFQSRKRKNVAESHGAHVPEEDEKPNSMESGAQSPILELDQVVIDFASIFCSYIPSVVKPRELQSKNKKRKETSASTSSDKISNKSDESVVEDLAIDGSENQPGSMFTCLRKCNKTPNSNCTKTCLFDPSDSAPVLAEETPQSKNSNISLDEDFWNEVMQVADGVRTGAAGDNLLEDKSSCAPAECTKGSISFVGLANGDIVSNINVKIKENNEKVASELSPLPVKHLDFVHEERKDEVAGLIAELEPDLAVIRENGIKSDSPTSSMNIKDQLKLSNWLPWELCSVYKKKGILQLYPWQVECLSVEGVLEKRNLVYCASTSAGKSLVAEILMLRRIMSTGKMAILVLPYVSICVEKAEHLELLLEPLGRHVRNYYGNQGGRSLPKDTSVAVCTIEKANSLVNRLLEEGRLSELGIIVIDELQMVGDPRRGYLLELMLTKLRYAAGEGKPPEALSSGEVSSGAKNVTTQGLQIVGMSATMPNVAAVADWLQAALYQTDFRPVPLDEFIKVGNTIYDKNMNAVRVIPKGADLAGKDPDHIVELCNEVVEQGHSVLLFCSSRKGCESTARHVSKFLVKFSARSGEQNESDISDIGTAIDALKQCPAGLDPVLEETLPCGVAYHHAGLTIEERDFVETCYRKGLVRVLTATSTLAAGVNLPARRVIFRQPRIGRDFIDGSRYRQMAGRAGRTGIDTKGESILVCRPEEVKRITSIITTDCPPLQSCLSEDKNGMTHAIMEVVASGIVQTADDINRYVRCTLLNSTKSFEDVVKSAQDSLSWLCHNKFLEWNNETKMYKSTPICRAAFDSSLSPEESLVVLDDLLKARDSLVLSSDLHLVYLVTPINVEVEPYWKLYYDRFTQLSALDQLVGNRVGVSEPYLMRKASGMPISMPSKEVTHRVSKRFYVALMLSRLVQETSIANVCEAFNVDKGMIQCLQENAGRFASMVSVFCQRLGWSDLEGIISKFQNRVSFGVRAEIAELTIIPSVKGYRARALYKAGLSTPLAIAEASVSDIAKALFESSSWTGQDVTGLQRIYLGIAKKIKNGARKIVFDQAEEAQLAAFMALKSLGLNVPQISKLLLPQIADNNKSENDTLLMFIHTVEVVAAASRDGRWRNQMHKAAHNGCCRRSAQIRALASVLGKRIVSENLSNMLLKIESPLVPHGVNNP
ncbi:helicase and polymerase-containing protein TEBICHI-like [Carex rostrata]